MFSDMRIAIAATVALVVGILLGFWGARFGEQTTLVSLSPDEATRVWIVERTHWIDRNFEVRVEDMKTQKMTTVFTSPDEGRPIGSERIVWSADSLRFLLLGRHFYASPESRLPTGESLYLLHDQKSGKVWCNASQQKTLPPFSQKDLSTTKWNGNF